MTDGCVKRGTMRSDVKISKLLRYRFTLRAAAVPAIRQCQYRVACFLKRIVEIYSDGFHGRPISARHS